MKNRELFLSLDEFFNLSIRKIEIEAKGVHLSSKDFNDLTDIRIRIERLINKITNLK